MNEKFTTQSNRGVVFETLEPRIVYSADLAPGLAEDTQPEEQLLEPAPIEQSYDDMTQEAAAGVAEVEIRREIVFIDPRVPDYEKLVEDIESNRDSSRHFEVVLLDQEKDGIEQIGDILAQYSDIDTIHLVSHGSEAGVQLGGTWLTTENLSDYGEAIGEWSDALTQEADFLIYGCNLAGSEAGQALIDSLGQLTGTDVAASEDVTGSAIPGGDWDLEYQVGDIESLIAFSADVQDSWAGTLSTVTFQEGVSGYTGTQDTYLDEFESTTNKGNDTNVAVDLFDGGSDATTQGLLRFDNIFGSGPGQIPSGSTITSAELTIQVTNPSEASAQITLHRMLQSWGESSTWNSLTNGIQTDDVEAKTTADATVASPTSTGSQTITGLAAALQSWSNGDTNNGWAFVSDSVDGWDFSSSENGFSTLRPKLLVEFTNSNAPAQVNNTGSELPQGGMDTITTSELRYDDNDQPATSVTYTVTTSPANGQLELTTNLGVPITSFTQDDIDNGQVVYVHDGTATVSDTFNFDVDDGLGNTTSGQSFSFTVNNGQTGSGLWTATFDDVSGTGSPGIDTWGDAEVLQFGDPNLALGEATDGTFSSVFDVDGFSSGDTEVRGLHYVTRDMTVGSGVDTIDLFEGDVLVSVADDVTMTSSNSLVVNKRDVFVFRPDTPSDYSSGTFQLLLDEPISGKEVGAFSLVEANTLVGDVAVTAGSFILTQKGQEDVQVFTADQVGENTTGGTFSVLIDGSDIDLGQAISGLELIEEAVTIGGQTLQSGQILATLAGNDDKVGDNNLHTEQQDVFVLGVTDAGSTTVATAAMLFDGSDVNLTDDKKESLEALSLFSDLDTEPPAAVVNSGSTVAEGGTDTLDLNELRYEDKRQSAGNITYTVTTSPTNGQLELNIALGVGITSFTQDDIDNNRLVYVHDGSNTTSDAFDFDVDDGQGNSVTGQSFSLTITAVNDAPDFGIGDGVVTTAVGPSIDEGRSVTVQADGKVLVAGYSHNGTDFDFALTRYNADGSLDTSFGSGGMVTTAIGAGLDAAYSVTVQTDGKILVAGESHNGTDKDFALVRYNTAGTLDASFGTGGVVTTAIGAGDDSAQSVTVQTDGKVVVAGNSHNGSDFDFALARYNSDGSLDTSFGTGGKVTTDIGSTLESGQSVTVQPDGKVVVGGYHHNGANLDFALMRYNTDGSLDTGFGTGGTVLTDFGTSHEVGQSVTLQADGKVLVAGYHLNGATWEFGLARYNADGSLDTGFGTGGTTSVDISAGDDVGYSVTVQADGKIVMSGNSANGADKDFALIRLNPDGSLDTGFGTGGKVTTDLGSGDDIGYSVTVQTDGKILVAGFGDNGTDHDFALARYNSDGTLDTSFDAAILNGNPTYIEGGAPVVLDDDVTVFDEELSSADSFNGATLTLSRNALANTEDVFSGTGNLSALTESGNLVLSGVTIGTVTTNSGGTLVLTFNANSNQARVNETLQSIAYANNSDTPPATVQIDWDFSDGNTGTQGAGGALSANGSTTVDITPVDNHAPTQTNNTGSTLAEGGTDTIAAAELTFTDTEQPASAVSFTVTTSPANGQLELTTAPGVAITSFTQDDINFNRVVYVHDGSNTTADTFNFDVDDGQGNTVTGQSFALTITAVDDDPPAVVNNTGSTITEGGTDILIGAELLFTDTEQAATSVTYAVTTSPANGQLELTTAPGVAISSFTQDDINFNRVVYVHDGSNTTADSFNFDVDDGQGNSVTGQSFNLTVTAVDDDPPVVVNNTGSTIAEGGTDTLIGAELLFTDTEQPATSVTYTVTTSPANGQLELTTAPGGGITSFTQDDIDNNRLVYVHDGSNTTSDTFNFNVDDGQGNSITGQSFALTITAVDDDAPVVVNNTGSTIAEGGADTLIGAELLFTDTEQPATSVTYTVTTSPANGQLELTTAPGVGITSFTQDDINFNRVVYVHDGSNTTADSFNFDVDDGQGNSVTGQSFALTITAVDDDPPVVVNNTGSTIAEGGTDTLISTELLSTDTEQPATSVTYTVTTSLTNGQLELTTAPGVGITSFTQDDINFNRVVYVHDGSNTTADSFNFDVDDGQGNSVTGQSFALTITAVDDDPPVVVNNTGSTIAEGGTDTLIGAELLFTDTEQPAATVTYTVTTSPANGQLELTTAPGVGITSFTQDDIDNNRLVYVHDGSNTTSDTFNFDVDDGQGNSVTGQSFNLTVTAVDDDPPVVVNNTGSTIAEGGTDTLASTELSFTDTEQPASAVSFTVTTSPANGQLELTTAPGIAITSFTQDDINFNRLVYVHDGSNTTSDTFNFDVDDGQGNSVTGQSFALTITVVDDDPPVVVNNTGSTIAEGGTDTIAAAELTFTDTEQPASAVSFTVTTSPANGQLELTTAPGVAITSFTQDDINFNRVVYVHDGSNTTSDSFNFDVDDGRGNSVTGQSFSLTITAVDDDAPVVVNNTGSTIAEGGTDTLIGAELLSTDTEQPATSVTYTVTTSPANGQLELTTAPGVGITSFTQDDIDNNRLVYVHDGSNTTSDTFNFDVDDGQGNSVTGQSFGLTITAVDDDPPVVVNNTGSTIAEGGTDTLIGAELLSTDTEQPATSVTYTVTTSPTNGQLELTTASGVGITSFTQDDINFNRLVYVHDGSNTTSDSFNFDVDDGQGNAVTGQSFSLTITAVDDDPPVVVNNTGSTIAEGGTDTLASTELSFADTEQPASAVSFTVTTSPANGQLELTTAPSVAITSFTQDDINFNRLVYVHDGSNTTADSFNFDVDDSQGNSVTGQSFALTIMAVDDDAPVQVNNTGSTIGEGGTDTLGSTELSFTDTEQPASAVSFTVTTSPANGQLELTTAPGVGITSFTQDDINFNRVVYVHDGSNTTADSFNFDVDDGQGNSVTGQSFGLTITAVDDDPPVVVNNTGSTIAEGGTDTLIGAELLSTDTEQPATSVTYTVTTSPANGQLELTTAPGVGITAFTQDDINFNRVVYVHDGSNTTADTFNFDVDDGQGNSVTGQSFNLTVTAVDDDAPVVVNNTGSTIAEGGTDTLIGAELLSTDTEQPATSVTYTVTTSPTNGQLELTTASGVGITSFTQDDIDNNRLVYVHDGSNTTADSFNFDVDDGQGNSVTGQSFNLTVTAVDDDPPVVVNNTGSTIAEGGTDTLIGAELLSTDTEQLATSVTYTVTTSPVNGQIELTTSPGVGITSFTQDDIDNNRLVYVHDGSNTTADTFNFDVDDGQGNSVTAQSFSLTITAVDDDAPTQVNNTGSTIAEGGTDTIAAAELTFTDTEQPASAVSFTVTASPANGQLELTTASGVGITSFTQDDINFNRLVYVHDGSNTTADSFNFDVDDGQGNSVTGQSFALTISSNDVPTTSGIADVNVNEDAASTSVDVFAAFQDEEDADTDLVFSITSNTNATLFSGTSIDGAGGTLELDYAANANGIADITLRATDTGGAFVETTFRVDVNAVNDVPAVLNNNSLNLDPGGTAALSASHLKVVDIEDAPANITFTLTNVSSAGTLMLSGVPLGIGDTFTQGDINNAQVAYTAPVGGTGGIAFSFTVTDLDGANIGATDFTVTINPPPLPSGSEGPSVPGPDSEPATEPSLTEPEDVLEEEAEAESETVEEAGQEEPPVLVLPAGENNVSLDNPVETVLATPESGASRSGGTDAANLTQFEQGDAREVPEEELVEEIEQPGEIPGEEINDALRKALELMKTDLDGAAEEENIANLAGAVAGRLGGVTLSAGYLAWLLRAGPLLASALSTMPMWTKFDPLPVVMAGAKKKKRSRYHQDEDSDEVTQLLDGTPSETRGGSHAS